MEHFHTRRIRQKPPLVQWSSVKNILLKGVGALSKISKRQWSYLMGFALIVVAGFIVVRVTTGVYHTLRNFSPAEAAFALGSDLKQDENGFTNIVLLGDGGHVRDGADLIDTIMVASLDPKTESVSLFSVPRDFYLKYIDHSEYAGMKINELYRDFKNKLGDEAAYELYQTVLGDITGLDIQYYARVDFKAFVEVVDSLGGITVDVKKAIYDTEYPNETDNGYTVFQMPVGPQEMDGETALKFARSRHSLGSSDYDRAARQQQIVMALKDKALSSGALTSPSTIKKLYEAVKNNTNTNLTTREMIALAEFAKNFDREHLVAKVIHDDPSQEGGFLYVPKREYFNNQFVLLPDGDSPDLIRRYADLIFFHREALKNPVDIEVLNATKKEGVARTVAAHLKRFGFRVVSVDNFLDAAGEKQYVEKSFIRYNRWEADKKGNISTFDQPTLDALSGFVKGEFVPGESPETAVGPAISIVLGADHQIF